MDGNVCQNFWNSSSWNGESFWKRACIKMHETINIFWIHVATLFKEIVASLKILKCILIRASQQIHIGQNVVRVLPFLLAPVDGAQSPHNSAVKLSFSLISSLEMVYKLQTYLAWYFWIPSYRCRSQPLLVIGNIIVFIDSNQDRSFTLVFVCLWCSVNTTRSNKKQW